MKKLHIFFALVLLFASHTMFGQSGKVDSTRFFLDEDPIDLVITSDLKNLLGKREQKAYQPASVKIKFPDSTSITEDVRVQTRGKFRLETCFMPPMFVNFKNPTSPKLRSLGKLKLVNGCASSKEDEQLIIKEYLAYKIYNILTPKSFRVRLAKITYDDSRGKVKRYSQYGFLLEDVDDMASRNKCSEVEGKIFNTEATDRQQMTLVALFEYMIGNTDWSVPNYHNIKLMRPLADSMAIPTAVPYDLNHCGLVNASYAMPPEELGIASVRERAYRGFPRSMEELDMTIGVFKKNKEKIWSVINNCEWLNARNKKDILSYIGEFYDILDNKNAVRKNFIDNARTQ